MNANVKNTIEIAFMRMHVARLNKGENAKIYCFFQ